MFLDHQISIETFPGIVRFNQLLMTSLPIYQVDAFTSSVFGGNPAAVCPLQTWLPDEKMQKLAVENNLSETAFFVKQGEQYHIRWFTPEYEIDLCGHATLASAFVIFNQLNHHSDTIEFTSKSGILKIQRKGDLIELNFPSRMPQTCEVPGELLKGVNIPAQQVMKSRDYFLVYETEEQVRNFIPDYHYLNKLTTIGIIITAPGTNVNFVSRFFVPNSVISEDPVTGSAHCSLIPYWAQRLGKKQLTARQISSREGYLVCEDLNDRVTMAGNAVLYMKGEYFI